MTEVITVKVYNQGVVVRVAVVAACIDACVLLVKTRSGVGQAQEESSRSWSIVRIDRIQFPARRSRIFKGKNIACSELMLRRKTPEMRVRVLDIGSDETQTPLRN